MLIICFCYIEILYWIIKDKKQYLILDIFCDIQYILIIGGNFMKYKCIACGYIYDESVEGIKFEDLSSDWVCPLCGVGKDMFEVIEN